MTELTQPKPNQVWAEVGSRARAVNRTITILGVFEGSGLSTEGVVEAKCNRSGKRTRIKIRNLTNRRYWRLAQDVGPVSSTPPPMNAAQTPNPEPSTDMSKVNAPAVAEPTAP